jgi:hypothetical protein
LFHASQAQICQRPKEKLRTIGTPGQRARLVSYYLARLLLRHPIFIAVFAGKRMSDDHAEATKANNRDAKRRKCKPTAT